MEINYKTKKLEKELTNPVLLKKYHGKDAMRINGRLSELEAANNLAEIPELPPPRRHKLSGDLEGFWSISYSKNNRIVIKPCGEYDINNLTTITEITILFLGDYH